MYRVTRLNPFSWAKTFTLAWLIIATVIALLVVIPFAILGGVGAIASEDARPLVVVIPVAIVGIVVGLLVVGIFVFVVALVQGLAFNWALGRSGGLEVDLGLGPRYSPLPATAAPTVTAAAEAAVMPAPPSPAELAPAAAEPDLPPEPATEVTEAVAAAAAEPEEPAPAADWPAAPGAPPDESAIPSA